MRPHLGFRYRGPNWSHASTPIDARIRLVKPVSLAATVIGADGLIIEVHNDPGKALSDGKQSLTPDAFDDVAAAVRDLYPFAYDLRKEGRL